MGKKSAFLDNSNLSKIKGKFVPISTPSGMIEIEKLYTFPSERKNLPFVFIESSKKNVLGIILARQSSDFLVLLAKKMILNHIFNKGELELEPSLIQYRFPKELTSLKLIIMFDWTDPEMYETIKSNLAYFQSVFRKKLDSFAKDIWKM